MDVVWDEEKNAVLKQERGISFEEIAGMILDGNYLEIVENPTRENQQYFILTIRDYTWVVPFLLDDSKTIILKTAFPSRKYHRRFGGNI
jgi:uncharacterized DUF497 family protein